MRRPWQKKPWPRIATSGRKSYMVGYYDHALIERTKTFDRASLAREWMHEYSAAERHGTDSLRRFLLDLDAAEANQTDGRTIGEVIELYFALDADPSLEGGLAPATFASYQNRANCYLLGHAIRNHKREVIGRAAFARRLAGTPAVRFNQPDAPRQWRAEMLASGASQGRCKETWKVLSAILSWAAGSHQIPEIRTNGCLLANERASSRRRSLRTGSTGHATRGRKHGVQVAHWALSPQAVEAIRLQLLARTEHRDAILAKRDAVVLSLQYGLGARNQEVWGLRWTSASEEAFMDIVEVISWGQLSVFGKTAHSTERRCATPSLLWEDLQEWRQDLRDWGHPARDVDFIIPGDLGGDRFGVVDERTGANHLTFNQCKKWGAKFFTPAVTNVAKSTRFANVRDATPYSLRRGGISARLRAEDAQTVAQECGTSLQMLDRHYAFAISDLRRHGPQPFDQAWREARENAKQIASSIS